MVCWSRGYAQGSVPDVVDTPAGRVAVLLELGLGVNGVPNSVSQQGKHRKDRSQDDSEHPFMLR